MGKAQSGRGGEERNLFFGGKVRRVRRQSAKNTFLLILTVPTFDVMKRNDNLSIDKKPKGMANGVEVWCEYEKLIPIDEVKENPRNPNKHPDSQIDILAKNIRYFGWRHPITVSKQSGFIVSGHGRLMAARKLGLQIVPIDYQNFETDSDELATLVADNRIAELSEMSTDDLNALLAEIGENIDLDLTGFSEVDLKQLKSDCEERNSLLDEYIVPPFSVLDSRAGYWQARKHVWHSFIKSAEGRDNDLIGWSGAATIKNLPGTSIFDPVLCEILFNWFCPKNGKVIDPFAGGSVRGIVASMLGNHYTGVDLSATQIEANEKNFSELPFDKNLLGDKIEHPKWIVGDSLQISELVEDSDFDFFLTCPPYYDLERYSDDPRDLSNKSYMDFLSSYDSIIAQSVAKLKPNAFAAIVVGDVRDKDGIIRDFVGATKSAFIKAGMKFYNDAVLLNAIGTAALRARSIFKAARKVCRVHQNVLVFAKGDVRKINLKPYEYEVGKDELIDIESQ